ncbi:hypothetical protein [Embleya scabrispora]|uniref:hypothetical protein n=1 Tax=Embleya scabrispora TaxID=159449 RepID=UPI0003AA7578|nr:hypothetical protein [Embleya scabrispora]MYS80891.1 hypothetical protein [Streptomyces sp. SID5474]
MVASSVDELRISLEKEATELAAQRDRLREELVDVERQLAARLSAVEHLALIRPLVPLPRVEGEAVAPVEVAPVEAEPVVEAPVEVAPAEEAPAEEAVVEETAVEEAPIEAAPIEEVVAAPAPSRKRKAVAATKEKTRIQAASTRKAPAAKPAAAKPATKPAAKPATKSAAKSTAKKKTTRAQAAPVEPVAPEPAAARPVRSHLRDEIAALLEGTGEPMNVRQLTEALGETATKSRMESVRTSTEGLVKAGRAIKAGRGLFTGPGA